VTDLFYNPRQFPYEDLMQHLLDEGDSVDTGHWQALKNVPHTRTVELQNVVIEVPIQPTPGSWAAFCRPNLPWAEDHFTERVSGEPTNPGDEYKNWPWFNPEWTAQDSEKKFSHTYQERFWPRWAGYDVERGRRGPVGYKDGSLQGIRYRYGDLNDVLELLRREPYTRQAYLPIWFPEDTGAHHGERVPCTLGYHFMLRDNKLHCFYPMRSVDLVRYLRDDAYMAGRLVQWILNQLDERSRGRDQAPGDSEWGIVQPGNLTMFMSSLHVFQDEVPALRRKHASNS
jgi:hypothetical protein